MYLYYLTLGIAQHQVGSIRLFMTRAPHSPTKTHHHTKVPRLDPERSACQVPAPTEKWLEAQNTRQVAKRARDIHTPLSIRPKPPHPDTNFDVDLCYFVPET